MLLPLRCAQITKKLTEKVWRSKLSLAKPAAVVCAKSVVLHILNMNIYKGLLDVTRMASANLIINKLGKSSDAKCHDCIEELFLSTTLRNCYIV